MHPAGVQRSADIRSDECGNRQRRIAWRDRDYRRARARHPLAGVLRGGHPRRPSARSLRGGRPSRSPSWSSTGRFDLGGLADGAPASRGQQPAGVRVVVIWFDLARPLLARRPARPLAPATDDYGRGRSAGTPVAGRTPTRGLIVEAEDHGFLAAEYDPERGVNRGGYLERLRAGQPEPDFIRCGRRC